MAASPDDPSWQMSAFDPLQTLGARPYPALMANAADEIIGIYRRHARAWTQARDGRFSEKNWIERFSEMLPYRGHVLDIGCGSGEPIDAHLAGRGYSITGVDSSPEMIEMFAANIPDQVGIITDMRCLRLGERFDGLLAWDSFFHLQYEDQRSMFPIFSEHCRSTGPLMFTSGPVYGEAMGILEGEPLYHASLAPSEYVQILDENGFDVIAHVAEDPAAMAGQSGWRGAGDRCCNGSTLRYVRLPPIADVRPCADNAC